MTASHCLHAQIKFDLRNLLSLKGFEIFICNKSLETGISKHKSGINLVENYSLGIYLFLCLSMFSARYR